MLENQPDEQAARIVEAAVERGIVRMRELGLAPDVMAFVEAQMRAAVSIAARALRSKLNAGGEQ